MTTPTTNRRAKNKKPMMAQIAITLPATLLAEVERIAKHAERSRSGQIRFMLAAALGMMEVAE